MINEGMIDGLMRLGAHRDQQYDGRATRRELAGEFIGDRWRNDLAGGMAEKRTRVLLRKLAE